jgi:tRNA A-37 threonylcarbamoyl transferase component Bud32
LIAQGSRDAYAPFTVRTESGEEVSLHTVLRALPDQRYSGFAQWRGREVFVKLFVGRRARIHWHREETGLRALIAAKINTPAILHSGAAQNGYVLVTERLGNAQTYEQLWQKAPDDHARRELLHALCGVLAQHHTASLRQTDLHWNNFVRVQQEIFSVDGAGIVKRKVNRGAALDNLALLLAQIYPRFDAFADTAYHHYAGLRGWTSQQSDVKDLRERIAKMRLRRKKEYLEKIFRDCSAFKCDSSFSRFTAYDRDFDTPALREFLANPDSAFSGEVLKKGNTSTVSRMVIDSQKLVVKRYNIKSFWHGLKRALRRTRAEHSWKNGHLLAFYGIATAKPIALIEKRFGFLRSTSYFIAEYIEGPNCRDYLPSAPPHLQLKIGRKIAALLNALDHLKLRHGDLKATNILIRYETPFLLDLDAMQESASAAARRRDRERFMRNWDDLPALRQLFMHELKEPKLSPRARSEPDVM